MNKILKDDILWSIYRITNPDGDIYIGKTKNVKDRIMNHRCISGHHKASKLKDSLSRYGWESHLFEVIDEFYDNARYANGKEIFWIKTYMSNSNRYPEISGLNLSDGGSGAKGHIGAFKGEKRPIEFGRLISKLKF